MNKKKLQMPQTQLVTKEAASPISPVMQHVQEIMEDPTHASFIRDYLLNPAHGEAASMFLALYSELKRLCPQHTASTRIRLLDIAIKRRDTRVRMIAAWRQSRDGLKSIRSALQEVARPPLLHDGTQSKVNLVD